MREHKTEQFSEDDVYELMMDALDGALSSYGFGKLEIALRQHPELRAEWEAMQAVDSFLLETPMIVPAPSAQFAERTMALLPNLRFRRWMTGAVYSVLLLSGFLPFAFIALVFGGFGALLGEPAFLTGLSQVAGQLLELGSVALEAMLQAAASSLGIQTSPQPALIGTLLVMIGSITLWSGVYRRLVAEPVVA